VRTAQPAPRPCRAESEAGAPARPPADTHRYPCLSMHRLSVAPSIVTHPAGIPAVEGAGEPGADHLDLGTTTVPSTVSISHQVCCLTRGDKGCIAVGAPSQRVPSGGSRGVVPSGGWLAAGSPLDSTDRGHGVGRHRGVGVRGVAPEPLPDPVKPEINPQYRLKRGYCDA